MGIAEKILAALLAAALLFSGGYKYGYRNAANQHATQQLKQEREARANYKAGVKRAIKQANQIAEQNAEMEDVSVQRRARIETVFQKIDREVIRYVQTDAGHGLCFDDDGLRLYNAANRGEFAATDQTAPSPGVPGAVPGIATGEGWNTGRSAANQQDRGAALLPLPGSASLTGRLGKAQP